MSVVARIEREIENDTKNLFESLDNRLKNWNSTSRYENLANLAELSLELSHYTSKSTDDLFKILSSVPYNELKNELYRLIHNTGPPRINSTKLRSKP